jgi:tetratricopeptide (TPR) repeat protein
MNPAIHATQCKAALEIRAKVNNNCVSCHMPKNGTIDIPHVTNTDHWIRVVETKSKNKENIFETLACINNLQPGARSRGIAYLSYYEKFSSNPAFLDSAARYFDMRSENLVRNLEPLIRLEFLRENYRLVIEYAERSGALKLLNKKSVTNDNAWTCYRIGQSYESSGDISQAITFYNQSVNLAPFIPDFRNKLASALQDNGQNDLAKTNYEFLLKENPKYASAYVNYGYLLLVGYNDRINAGRMYEHALALDPDNVQALLNMAGLSMLNGNKSDCRKYLNEVLKRDRSNQTAKTLLDRLGKNS